MNSEIEKPVQPSVNGLTGCYTQEDEIRFKQRCEYVESLSRYGDLNWSSAATATAPSPLCF